MIDINLFVGQQDVRTWLNKPFNLGNETIASNGHVIVAVPKIKGYRSLMQKDRKAAAGVQRVLDLMPEENMVELPEPVKATEFPCRVCFETGKAHVKHVPCDGDGCDGCDHRGEVEANYPCRYCGGTAKNVAMKIGQTQYHINEQYLNLIKDLPGLRVAIDSKNEKLFWRIPEARGIIMGMRI